MNAIRYLERSEIDISRWDRCIDTAANGRIYGYSSYLDLMSTAWSALVVGDYRAVVPLPYRSRYGIHYLYPPAFTGPLAIYGVPPQGLSAAEILAGIPEKFRLWDMNIDLKAGSVPWPHTIRKNHVLPLAGGYDAIRKRYRASVRNTLNRRRNKPGIIRSGIPIGDVVDAAAAEGVMGDTIMHDRERLKSLYAILSAKDMAWTTGLFDISGKLIAAALFFRSHQRIYYMAAWSGEAGRAAGGSVALMDHTIRAFAGQDMVLDFEGSDIPGIAFFFEGFGADIEEYLFIRKNGLPWWCRWMKGKIA